VNATVRVACVQAEPVIFDRDATMEKVRAIAAEAAGGGAQLVVFPETFVPVYPSNRWVRHLSHGDAGTPLFGRLLEQSIEVPGPDADALGAVAREHGLWLAVGVNERERGTIYNALLVFAHDGTLALHHRKLVPTNHERLVWGQGDGRGLDTVDIGGARAGGLICWENYMPLARFALYERGVEIYLAPNADDSEEWHHTLRHIARESRAFVVSPCSFQRASSYPGDVPLADGDDLIDRGGSAILSPDGEYLAGPLWDEEGLLFADLEPAVLHAARQRFDPAGHYSRPELLSLQRSMP
jgi:nitrilase